MKKSLLILFTIVVFSIFGQHQEKKTKGRPGWLARAGYPDPGLYGPNETPPPLYKYPTTLMLTYDDEEQPPLVCNVDRTTSFAGSFDVPPLLAGLVEFQVLPIKKGKEDELPVAAMVHLTGKEGSVDKEFRRLLRGESSTERRFLRLLQKSGSESVRLELPEDDIGPVRIVHDGDNTDVLCAPSIEELFSQLFKNIDPDTPEGRELQRYRQNTQVQTLRLRRGERNHFKLVTNPRWQRGKGETTKLAGHYGKLFQTGNNRFRIVPTIEIPEQSVEPEGLEWFFKQIVEAFK